MASLYEMDEQLKAIDFVLTENEDAETAQILESARAELEKDIETKMESILKYMSECGSKINGIKEEITRLQNKVKSLTNKKDFLKTLCQQHLESNNIQKAEYGTYSLSIAKTPGKVVLADDAEMFLPDQLCIINRTPNKTAIKDAMVDGVLFADVDGKQVQLAHLETGATLRIK